MSNAEYMRAYYLANKQLIASRMRARHQALRETPEGRFKILSYFREWRAKNPDKIATYKELANKRRAERRLEKEPERVRRRILLIARTGQRQYLAKQMGVKFSEVPAELVEAHVSRLLVKREIKAKMGDNEKERGT